jgi:fatty acid desaturase
VVDHRPTVQTQLAAVVARQVQTKAASERHPNPPVDGHNDTIQTFLCGALNYQVEHHLFPGVSQYYYPELAPMVRATCKEFGLPYIYKRNFVDAFSAHWRYLRDMGKLGKQVHMD